VLPAEGGSEGTTKLPRREGEGELNGGRGRGRESKKRDGGGIREGNKGSRQQP